MFEATVVSAIKLAAAVVELLALNHHGTQAGIHGWRRWSNVEAESGTRIYIDSHVYVLCRVTSASVLLLILSHAHVSHTFYT